jgi:rubrerythrin
LASEENDQGGFDENLPLGNSGIDRRFSRCKVKGCIRLFSGCWQTWLSAASFCQLEENILMRLIYDQGRIQTFTSNELEAHVKDKTRQNVYNAFIGEAKAYFRLLAYAEKADEEKVPQIALLFRVIAEAERVHASRMMGLAKDLLVKDTDTNLENSFQREKTISENDYPDFIKDAEDEGEPAAALAFTHARDAESFHAKLYERAIYHMIKQEVKAYHICQVCGYVTEKSIPEKCPVCGAPKEKFKTMEA